MKVRDKRYKKQISKDTKSIVLILIALAYHVITAMIAAITQVITNIKNGLKILIAQPDQTADVHHKNHDQNTYLKIQKNPKIENQETYLNVLDADNYANLVHANLILKLLINKI